MSDNVVVSLFICLGFYLFFQHCTGHITTGSFIGRGNQYHTVSQGSELSTADQRQATTSFPT